MKRIDTERIQSIHTIEDATDYLFSLITPSSQLRHALAYSIEAHEGQFRKSGEPYVVHPILVGAIAASITDDESIVQAALLHDILEDTDINVETVRELYGDDVTHLVEGITKIEMVRDEHLVPSHSDERLIVSALSFRKMLLASIEDVRVLVVKLCDRLHNMLTLHALPKNKQQRIAEETLVVYAPIAHRLGISFVKNLLEDICFEYLFPDEMNRIQSYLDTHYHAMEFRLNAFREKIQKILLQNGFLNEDFEILSRVKHDYSIYLKMQRKGIGIDEILDLLAIRILVKKPIDCYRTLGLIHLNFQPLSSRFKDYIALAKDNGYQTLHTTVFDDTAIFEVQIRTFDMHETAELGVAAHWKYKNSTIEDSINLEWLNNLQYQNESVEDFYELIKNDLYSEDISVFSPRGKPFTLPRGAVVLDFAYAVHSEIGDNATGGQINKQKVSLLSELHNGDIVKIITGEQMMTRCSWIDTVKTSRAKSHMRTNCNNRMREIDKQSGVNIVATIMGLKQSRIEEWFRTKDCKVQCYKIPRELDNLKEVIHKYMDEIRGNSRFVGFLSRHRFKLRPFEFGALQIFFNQSISEVEFDYCCHPKAGDSVVAFFHKNKAQVHHKMCHNAQAKIEAQEPMLFVRWKQQSIYHYHLIVSMKNAQSTLAGFLDFLAKSGIDIRTIEMGAEHEEHVQLCEIECQSLEGDLNRLRAKIEQRIKIIQLIRTDDAYRTL